MWLNSCYVELPTKVEKSLISTVLNSWREDLKTNKITTLSKFACDKPMCSAHDGKYFVHVP